MSNTSTFDTHAGSDDEPEACWHCNKPLSLKTALVTVGGIFCNEDCHEAFALTPEVTLINRKDTPPMAESVEQLTIYKLARQLEDEVYELVKTFPADQFYGLGNDLRRSSAAVSHHIMECHRLYSYRLKLDELSAARREAEAAQQQLERARDLSATDELMDGYTNVIKQSWGLTKWLQAKLDERSQEKAA